MLYKIKFVLFLNKCLKHYFYKWPPIKRQCSQILSCSKQNLGRMCKVKIGVDSYVKGENGVRGYEAKSWNVSLHFCHLENPSWSMLTHLFNEGKI